MTLKQKTVSGMIWSFLDSFANQGILFIIGIVLARILSPREFGLIGMLTIFIALSQSFIDSGFTNALIRKQDCTQTDYSTVFYYNFVAGIIFYLILFLFAKSISVFFNEPQLELLLQVLGLGLILNSLGIIQRTILTKNINFKLQARVSAVSATLSGLIAISMAYNGYGVWSLVALTLGRFGFTSVFLWMWTKWKPNLIFSIKSFKELFSFGSKLLITGLIETIYRNIYLLIIGKYFSAVELGYYTRADQFSAMPSANLTQIVQKVSYPVLSNLQEDVVKLKSVYCQIITSVMLVTFVLMLGMAAVAEPLILTLIGEQWTPAIIYLQLLCFVGMFYPLHALNLNMLQVQGRGNLLVKIEIIKKILAVPIIIIGILLGIKALIVGMIIHSSATYFLNSYYSGRFIKYSSIQQLKDISSSFFLAVFVSVVVFVAGKLIHTQNHFILLIQILIGAILTFGIVELIQLKSYIFMKDIVMEKIRNKE